MVPRLQKAVTSERGGGTKYHAFLFRTWTSADRYITMCHKLDKAYRSQPLTPCTIYVRSLGRDSLVLLRQQGSPKESGGTIESSIVGLPRLLPLFSVRQGAEVVRSPRECQRCPRECQQCPHGLASSFAVELIGPCYIEPRSRLAMKMKTMVMQRCCNE